MLTSDIASICGNEGDNCSPSFSRPPSTVTDMFSMVFFLHTCLMYLHFCAIVALICLPLTLGYCALTVSKKTFSCYAMINYNIVERLICLCTKFLQFGWHSPIMCLTMSLSNGLCVSFPWPVTLETLRMSLLKYWVIMDSVNFLYEPFLPELTSWGWNGFVSITWNKTAFLELRTLILR